MNRDRLHNYDSEGYTYVCMHLLLQHNSHRRVCVVNVAIVVITPSASPCHLSCTGNCGIDDVIDTLQYVVWVWWASYNNHYKYLVGSRNTAIYVYCHWHCPCLLRSEMYNSCVMLPDCMHVCNNYSLYIFVYACAYTVKILVPIKSHSKNFKRDFLGWSQYYHASYML